MAQQAWQPDEYDLRLERLQVLSRLVTPNVLVGWISTAAVVAATYGSDLFTWAMGWFALICLSFLCYFAFVRIFRLQVDRQEVNVALWEWLHTGSSFVAGILWAVIVAAMLFWQAAPALMLVGLSAVLLVAQVFFLGPLLRSFFGFILPVLAAGVWTSFRGPESPIWPELVVWIGALITLLNGIIAYRIFSRQYIEYRLLNSRLAAEMMAALEDPRAGVLRVQQGDVQYANERMAEMSGLPLDQLARMPLGSILGPGPWADPNWTQLKQTIDHGIPQTYHWQLPHQRDGLRPVQVRVRGVWDFARSHGGVLLFSPGVVQPLSSSNAASETYPVLLDEYDAWRHLARAELRKRASARSAVAVISIQPPGLANEWFARVKPLLLARMLPRQALCVRGQQAYLWLGSSARDLTPTQLRTALINALLPHCDGLKLAVGAAMTDGGDDFDRLVRKAESQLAGLGNPLEDGDTI
jgi:PAS domain-containing protein